MSNWSLEEEYNDVPNRYTDERSAPVKTYNDGVRDAVNEMIGVLGLKISSTDLNSAVNKMLRLRD